MKKTLEDQRAHLSELLEPCFDDSPRAGAVILLCDNKGVQFVNLNMSEIEMAQVLMDVSMYMCNKLGVHTPPETLQ